jgi:hypothetical protein
MSEADRNALAIRDVNELDENVFGLELKIINAVVGNITTNAVQVLEAVKSKCAEYKDIEKYIGREDVAKKERAQLNKAMDRANDMARRIKTMWMAPLDEFDNTMKLVKAEYKTASTGLDELVKLVENKEKDKKRQDIQVYFDGKDFDLVPLDMFFDTRWLNKGYKLTDIKKEIDAKIAEIYGNIKVLENIADHGAIAKAFYLETLDMGAAMVKVQTLKDNAERLAREQAEREQREHQAQINQNFQEQRQEQRQAQIEKQVSDLASQALDLPQESARAAPKLYTATLRFTGTREKLEALKSWMSQNGISYEKIEEGL